MSSNSWSAITHVLYFRHSSLSTSLFSLHSCNCIWSNHFAHCGSWKPLAWQSSKTATCCLWMVSPKRTSGPMATWSIPIIANDAATIIIPIPTFLRWWGSFIQSLNLNWWHLILKEIKSKLQTLAEKEKRLNFSQDVIVYSDSSVWIFGTNQIVRMGSTNG